LLGFPLLGGADAAVAQEFLIQFSAVHVYYNILFMYNTLYNNTTAIIIFRKLFAFLSKRVSTPCRKSTISSARGAPPRHGKQNVLFNTHPSAYTYRRDRRCRHCTYKSSSHCLTRAALLFADFFARH